MTELLSQLGQHTVTPKGIVCLAVAFLLFAAAIGTVAICLAYAIRHLLADTFTEFLLEAWRFLIAEIKGEKDKAGIINAIGVIAFTVFTLIALVLQLGSPIWDKIVRNPPPLADVQFPWFTLAMAVLSLFVLFGSIYAIRTNEQGIAARQRASDLTNRSPAIDSREKGALNLD